MAGAGGGGMGGMGMGGYGQVAGAVIQGVSEGVSSYYGAKQAQGAVNFANQQTDYQFKQTKKNAEYQDDYNDDLYAHLRTLPNLTQLNLGPTSGLSEYLQQAKYLPKLGQMTSKLNANYRAQIGEVAPDFIPAFKQTASNVLDWSQGKMGDDTAAAAQRGAAQAALAGGYGAGSGMFVNRTARDFGLTTDALKQRAAGLIPSVASVASSLSPVNLSSLLLTPNYLQERTDQQAMTNWQVGNQNNERAFMRTMPEPPHYADYLVAPPHQQYNGMSPWLSAVNTFWNSVGGALAGSGGGSSSSGGGGGQGSMWTGSGGAGEYASPAWL